MNHVNLPHCPRARAKLDPRLATLVELGVEVVAPGELERFQAEVDEGAPLHRQRREGSLAFLRGGLRSHDQLEVALPQGVGFAAAARRTVSPPSVSVFVRARSSDALDRLACSGIQWISRARTIATADLPLARVAELEADDSVVAIEWTGAFRPQGEAGGARGGCAAIGLDPDRFGLLDGRGCILGVVDVEGIDLYHPCFVDCHGRTRLLALWDQRAVPADSMFLDAHERGPGGLGVVHRREAIGLEISPHQLLRSSVVDHRAIKGSHGTLTSALAMGLGEDRRDARGVAPGADLVFVSTFGSGPGALGAMTELAEAIAFIVSEADARKVPCVVNVSLGDDLGPRDGTSPIEQFIDELLETPGRGIVVAAGNSHGKGRHAEMRLDPGATASFDLCVAPRNTERAVVEIWYDAVEGPGGLLSLEVEAPGRGGQSPAIEPDGIPRAFDSGSTRLLILSSPHYPGPADSRRNNAVIRVELAPVESGEALLAGTWKLHLRAKSRAVIAHAWVDHRYAHWETPSDSLTLTTPATARRALVVGAHDEGRDGAAWFSGRGVDRGGVEKPDLLAPGVTLVGAWAESTVRYIDSANGTSFAAPLVAGTAALLFQKLGERLSAGDLREEILALTRSTGDGARTLWVADLPARPPVSTATYGEARCAARAAEGAVPGGRLLPRMQPRDAAQIVQGVYQIFRGHTKVGQVLVMPGDRPGVSVEHWALGPDYQAPSHRNPDVSLRFKYMGLPVPLDRFAADLPRDAVRIRATCELASVATHRVRTSSRSTSSTPGVVIPTPQREQMMDSKNYMRPLDRTQIIQGKYLLYQGQTEVGGLLVTDDSPGVSTEHWLLSTSYMWPSASNPSQELRFEYKGSVVPVSEFLQDVPTGTTYVIARCEQQTLA